MTLAECRKSRSVIRLTVSRSGGENLPLQSEPHLKVDNQKQCSGTTSKSSSGSNPPGRLCQGFGSTPKGHEGQRPWPSGSQPGIGILPGLLLILLSSFNLTEATEQNTSSSLGVNLEPQLELSVPPNRVNVTHNATLSQDPKVRQAKKVELFDEENDAKLYLDMVNSIKDWQTHKLKLETYKRFSSKMRYKRDEEVVCYGDLGCFRDEGPFDYLDMLPSPPEEIQTTFFLYTPENPEISQIISYNNVTSIKESNFNVSIPLKIIIHGFGSGCNRVWPREMRLSFLAVEKCNVICVDWTLGAADPNYVRAAVNTRLVGKQVAILMRTLSDKVSTAMNENTHIIGFSLGAHVAGFAGSELKNLSRITGLDPAGPLFEGYDVKVRLDKTDANYVDVIHSNGESLIVGGFGVWEPIGHVDFYPNGGRAQRGCQHLIIGGLYDFIYSYSQSNETYRYLCNHRRAYKLFTNSISPKCKFNAFPCESYEKFESGACFSCNSKLGECGQLGYYSNTAPGRGSLYLMTRDEDPFCGNQLKVNIMFTGSRLPLYTYGRLQLLLVDKNGLNETHLITEDVDDLITSGSQIEKLLVLHPAIVPVEAHILYVAYDGWIYSGRFQWSLDKLVITDDEGKKSSFCKENGQHLPSGIPVKLKLKDGDCIANSLKASPEYPLVPYRRYPNKPYDHIPPKGAALPIKKRPNEHKIQSSSGQDGLYITNSLASDSDVTITINDAVAPKSVPSQVMTFNNGQEVKERPMKVYRPPEKKILPPHRALPKVSGQGRPLLPKIHLPSNKWPNQPHYAPLHPPYYVNVPAPGPWISATNRPGSLPPPGYQGKRPPQLDNGIEVRYGPKFPTPPSQFPARRRPSTKFVPRPPVGIHRRPPIRIVGGGDSVPSGSHFGAQYRPLRPIDKSDHGVTEFIETLQQDPFDEFDVNETDEMKIQLMSDDQLTIVKIGTEDELHRSNNNSVDLDTQGKENNTTKIDYIVFHKLPNGEALNLENLRTYNMEDIEQGKVENPEEEEVDLTMLFDGTNDQPRGFNTFSVNEGNDALRPDAFDSQRIHAVETPEHQMPRGSGDDKIDAEDDEYFDDPDRDEDPPPQFKQPPTSELKISTQAPTEEEVYNPTPLKDLEDLDAMPFQEDKPVYIIHEEDLVDNSQHPYFANFNQPPVPRRADPIVSEGQEEETAIENQGELEILRVQVDRQDRRIIDQSGTVATFLTSEEETAAPLGILEDPTPTNDWIPIPTKVPPPTFGPRNKPTGYHSQPIDVEDVHKITNIATVRLTDVGPLAEEIKQSPISERVRPISVQYLPQRFTTTMTRISDKDRSLHSNWPQRPGLFRENKIAPIFKHDPLGLDRSYSRALPHVPHVPHMPRSFGHLRHPRRILSGHPRPSSFQSQFIPQTAPARYIPLHLRQSPRQDRLWWQPHKATTVSDTLEAPKALTRDSISVDSVGSVLYPNVDISSPKAPTERTLAMLQEEEKDLEPRVPSNIITSTEGKLLRMQEPFVPDNFVPNQSQINDNPPLNATMATLPSDKEKITTPGSVPVTEGEIKSSELPKDPILPSEARSPASKEPTTTTTHHPKRQKM